MHMVFAGGGDKTKIGGDNLLLNLMVSRCDFCRLGTRRRKKFVPFQAADGLVKV